jgi:transposase
VKKYVDHLPLVRQVSMLARQGVHLSKQTLCGWIRQISDLLEPVERAVWTSVLSSAVLMADETTVKLQQPGQCKTSYLWGYLGDRGEIVFDFSTSRASEAPLAALEGFTCGTFVCDKYSGYNETLRSKEDVERSGCWAHARRYFYEAKTSDKKRALRVLALIKRLYDVEVEAAGLAGFCRGPAERERVVLAVRQMNSVPLLEMIEAALKTLGDEVLPKSPMSQAITYAMSPWEDLCRFASDGAIPIDNNAIEREIRPIAVGRRNWTFCGSEDGGAWAARLYGLFNTCRLQGVNPYEWLQDVLTRVRDHPPDRMAELAPRQWAAARRAAEASADSVEDPRS